MKKRMSFPTYEGQGLLSFLEIDIPDALAIAAQLAAGETAPLVYIGGSTYVVSEAVCCTKA